METKNWEEEFFEKFGEDGNVTNGKWYKWKLGMTPKHVAVFIAEQIKEAEKRGAEMERDRIVPYVKSKKGDDDAYPIWNDTLDDVVDFIKK